MEDIVLTEKSVVALNKDVALRFEHNFNGGTLILIDTKTENIWYGNKDSLAFINELKDVDNPRTLGKIYTKVLSAYQEFEPEKVIESLNFLLNNLYENKFLDILAE